METFSEFEQQSPVPQRNFSDILSHAFNTYFKVIGWCMLGFVIYLIISTIISSVSETIAGYDSTEMAENMRELGQSGGNIDDMMNSVFRTPGLQLAIGFSSLAGILLAPFYTGIIYLMHKANRGLATEFSDLFIGFRQNYVQYVVYALITSVALSLGLLLCGIGFFFVLPFFFTGIPMILFENKNAVEALQKSFETGKNNYGTLLGVGFIVSIIAVAGVMLCFIGIVATFPFYYAAMYSTYIAFWGVPQLQRSHRNM